MTFFIVIVGIALFLYMAKHYPKGPGGSAVVTDRALSL